MQTIRFRYRGRSVTLMRYTDEAPDRIFMWVSPDTNKPIATDNVAIAASQAQKYIDRRFVLTE